MSAIIDAQLWRCVACHGPIQDVGADWGCEACGRAYPVRDGVVVFREAATDNNRVAKDFYDGPLWPKFRFWERMFWLGNGGERKAREHILKYLPKDERLTLVDVAIGDGVYLNWLPKDWKIVGVDISTAQLRNCRARIGERQVALAMAEAEGLPFREGKFDAALSIGGLNHFNDPEKALRELSRVVKPGGTIVVSDEHPDITGKMIGHRLGIPGLVKLDNWVVSRVMHLGPEFTELVERNRLLDIAAIGKKVFDDCKFEWIWKKAGCVMIGTAKG
ncbi:MAG: hypothetical protein NVSMB14_17650 [Isosphaeraceae bacterium]